jgi:uncharacterized protein YjbI with pentapeptide repeats
MSEEEGRKMNTIKYSTLKSVERAVRAGKNLKGLDLFGVNFSGAKLSGAKLADVDFSGADMSDCDLSCAKLSWTSFAGVNLSRANFSGADLIMVNMKNANLQGGNFSGVSLAGVDLRCAELSYTNLAEASFAGVNLTGACMRGAIFGGTNLKDAYLDLILEDFYAVLVHAKDEAAGLLQALKDGRIDGSLYEGECACLVGTIANLRGKRYTTLGRALRPDSFRPAERWFTGISEGDMPTSNPVSEITVEWAEAWIRGNR